MLYILNIQHQRYESMVNEEKCKPLWDGTERIYMITKTEYVWYQVHDIRTKLMQEKESSARKALSVIQLWEVISVDGSVQRDLKNLGIDCSRLREFRNWLAHCNTFNYEELDDILDVLKSERLGAFILERLQDGIHEYYKDSVMLGAYNSRIREQI